MKPEQALQVLEEATQPANAGRITRSGYVQIEQALYAMKKFIEAHVAKEPPTDKPNE